MGVFTKHSKTLLGLVLFCFSFVSLTNGVGQVLNPPYFNLAEGRRITATATCGVGVSEPELYCKLVGAHADQKDNPNVNLIQGQVCDYCDPEHTELSHPPEFAIDGSERWWQSPPLSRGTKYNEVNLTIDLGQEFHVAYVFIKMANSPRPGIWVLEKSQDLGKTWQPWQYFADTPSDCVNFFGQQSLAPITSDDSVICDTKFSKVVPLEGGEIVVSLLNERPSANNFYNSSVLQEWTKATNIRLKLIRTKTLLGHLMSVARQDPTVTRRYFYSIRDINVGGRCVCNGHANLCDITDPLDAYKLLCRCQHNTCGPQCDECCTGFNQKKWRRATPFDENACEPCNCFDHSHECEYDDDIDRLGLSLDIHGDYSGGGVCKNCQHNTEGINCDRCIPGYFRPYGKLRNATDVCQPCVCDLQFSTGSCADETGRCECRPEFLPPYCTSCNLGYYGYPNCRPCDCNVNGTRDTVCEVGGGQCPCKPNYTGKNCDQCARDYYGFPDCLPCSCNPTGSSSTTCEPTNGQCVCRSHFGGRSCGECDHGFYDYPECKYCNCDLTGTNETVCDKNTGTCICKEGYGGSRCDTCAPGYHGYPNCQTCECNTIGSLSNICDNSGKCPCNHRFSGHLCNQCSPGYYKYPECIDCECDSAGSYGLSCDDSGKCQCKPSFDGPKCNSCKKGYYNYPACEDCNCDPAGVASTFAGCDNNQSSSALCVCKERVQGRICNHCRALYWNLQASNQHGCEDCNCHPPGTIGGIAECDQVSGNCICKANVGSRQCRECADGYYNLQEDNLFGCTECGCNIGGALNSVCDKRTGQCVCRPRIDGRTCDQPIKLHYFPSLFQHQYEAEAGKTPGNTPVRFAYDSNEFPDYSWRGYAVFSAIQREVLLNIEIDKPSLYRTVLHYVNLANETIVASVTFSPESYADTQQSGFIRFEPTVEPGFVMASSSKLQGSTPASFVLNPGRWTVTIKGEKQLLLDYIVLLPAAYYEGTVLLEDVKRPCTLGVPLTKKKCRHFKYSQLSNFPLTKCSTGYIAEDDKRIPIKTYSNETVLQELDVGTLATLDSEQKQFLLELSLPRPGRYVFVVQYHTPDEMSQKLGGQLTIETTTANGREKGYVNLAGCLYSSLCRQVVVDHRGKMAHFNFGSNQASLDVKLKEIIELEKQGLIVLDSIVAIPYKQWNIDYLKPRSACIKEEGKCLEDQFQSIPGSTKVEAESGNDKLVTQVLPDDVFDDDISLVYLSQNESMVDIRGSIPNTGPYVFIVHYYQPHYPEFELDVLIQNGQFYEGKLPVPFCPSVSGCRSVVISKDNKNNFQILENFMVTLKRPEGKHVWIDYILAIPKDSFKEEILHSQLIDRSVEFISQCGDKHFYLDSKTEGYCRNATFALTAEHNNGGLRCECDYLGSRSFQCEKFGGQCPCKPFIIGRKCQECRTGYFGFPNCKECRCPSTAICHPSTGECICPPRVTGDQCNECLPNTYGYDPIIGCEDCHCNPFGVQQGNLQCNPQTGECDCKPNVVTRTCDKCQAGYWNFPRCQLCECDLRGATEEICDMDNSWCFCKENVEGPQCDTCRPGTFNLEEENPVGCTKCFCSGKTDRCSSSALYWSSSTEQTGWRAVALVPNTVSVQVHQKTEVLEGDPHPISVDLPFSTSPDVIYYFSAPQEFLGNKIAAYGGKLRYTLDYTKRQTTLGVPVIEKDVILKGNNISVMYEQSEQAVENIALSIEVELREWNFRHFSGASVTREQMMTLLSSLDKLFIRAHYNSEVENAKLFNVSLDVAEENYYPGSELAMTVEQCSCPPNYQGLSCESCAPGYYRAPTGPFGGYCVPCQCNGHADTCDSVTGVCINCKHSSVGDHCERCDIGYHGDARIGSPNDCLICACPLPMTSNNFANSCELSQSGLEIRCECKSGYIGARCDYCSPGFYGRPEVIDDYCKPCECSGNIDPHSVTSCDSVTGQCLHCLNNTYGSACELCAPGFYGDAVSSKNCKKCYCDDCGTRECHHSSGTCTCFPNVVGEKCDECAPGFWGFDSCEGCIACNCSIAAHSHQCDVNTGQCKCRPGVSGRTCDRCLPGYWDYSSGGCQPCRCNQDYSIGGTCNLKTGRCECLPGVIGDRCDSCPYRWVLIDNVGCQECGPCVHTLLDDLDDLHNLFDPVWADLKGVAFSFFAYQKLDNVNQSVSTLRPLVDNLIADPTSIDLKPLRDEVDRVEQYAKSIERQLLRTSEVANRTANESDATHKEALRIEALIRSNIADVRGIIAGIEALSSGFLGNQGPNRDRLLAEAERMLEEIKARDFEPMKVKADDELEAAKDVLEKAKRFVDPALENSQRVAELKAQMDNLRDKLKDLVNNSNSANADSTEAEHLNKKNENPPANEKVKKITASKEAIDGLLEEAQMLLDKAKALLDEARNNFVDLDLDDDRFGQLIDRLKNYVDDLKNGLKDVAINVRKAEGHAKKLQEQAAELDGLLADTRGSAENAVKAANSYGNIVDAIKKARDAAEVAVDAAQNATAATGGLDGDARDSLRLSKQLLDEALLTRGRVEGDLAERLGKAKAGVEQVAVTNAANRKGIDEINRAMDRLPSRTLGSDAERAAAKSERANGKAQDAIEKVKIFKDQLPKIKDWAEQMPRDIDDANKAIKRAIGQVDKVQGMVPDLVGRMDRIAMKASASRLIGFDVGDKIAAIRRKIALSVDQANRISVGMRFYPNSTLELRNPEGIHRSATSTKFSLYVKTSEPNGFLAYIGSPVGTHKKVKRSLTDDYMALEVIDGKSALTMDLGSGHKKIVNDVPISDGQWHEIIVDRIGPSVSLKVRTESPVTSEPPIEITVEDTLPGTFSVFNLDQELSKFYIGGFPSSSNIEIQPEVAQHRFDGAIEDVMFDEKPVGLWNFIKAENTEGEVERDKLVVLSETGRGVRFSGSGYVILEKKRTYKFEKQVGLVFRFKTYSDNGLLFLIGKGNKYYSLELINGSVVNQMNLGSGAAVIRGSKLYNDGQWHSVDATRLGKDMLLKIDGEEVGTAKATGRSEQLEVTNRVYVGGYPQTHDFPQVTNTDFEGCIDNFQIGALSIRLTSNLEALGVVQGCPVTISRSVSFTEESNGYIGMPSMALGMEPQLTFRFKTVNPNGLLFYAGNSDQTSYISLSLFDGGLALRAKPGGDVQSGISVRYNDSYWHYISATKNGSHLQIVIDDYDVFETRATAVGEITSTTPLYFGGVPSNLILPTGATQSDAPFIGCIGDVTINGKFQNFADGRQRSGAQLINCPLQDPQTIVGQSYQTGNTTTYETLPPVIVQVTRATPRVTSRTTAATTTTTTTEAPTTPTTTTAVTTTTTKAPRKPPIKHKNCKLPLYPERDPDFSASDGIRFGSTMSSREEYYLQTGKLKNQVQMSLEFKTKAKDGILFYVSDTSHRDMLAAYLKDGKVTFTFNLGSGRVEISSTERYNDNEWHTIDVSRLQLVGTLAIDGKTIRSEKSSGTLLSMNVINPLYIGGVLPNKSIKSNLQGVGNSLNGCIRNINFNKDPVGQPTLNEGTSPCSDNVEVGAFFGADGGQLVIFDEFRVGMKLTVKMEIRPRNLNGVLLGVQDKKKKDFLFLQIIDGNIRFSVDNGIGIISTTYKAPSDGYLCDGEWHSIVAVKDKNVVTISVDNKFADPGLGVPGVSATDTNDPLYIGGVPADSKFRDLQTKSSYVGCIRNLQINKREEPLVSGTVFGDVTPGSCPTV
ncbi:hypothetical protein CHUAL_011266 [Chamberlinius hualienensis]